MDQKLRENIKYLMDWQEFKPETFGFIRQEETLRGFEKLIAEAKEAEGKEIMNQLDYRIAENDSRIAEDALIPATVIRRWMDSVLSARYGTNNLPLIHHEADHMKADIKWERLEGKE